MEEQSKFHKSSSEKNKKQIELINEKLPLIKDRKALIWLTFGIALLSLLLTIVKLFTSLIPS